MNKLTQEHLTVYKRIKEKMLKENDLADMYGSPLYSASPGETKFLIKIVEILLPNNQTGEVLEKDKPANDLLLDLLDEVDNEEI